MAPKCVLCVLAYAGLGAAIGIGGPELCGDSGNSLEHWIAWLPVPGVVAAVYWVARHRICSRFSFKSSRGGEG